MFVSKGVLELHEASISGSVSSVFSEKVISLYPITVHLVYVVYNVQEDF